MKNGYSIDLRERVVAYIEEGGSKVTAAKLFQVSRRIIYYWLERKRKQGNLKPSKAKKYKVKKLDEAKLVESVKTCPDATLAEMAEQFAVRPSTVWYALKRLKITRKKNRSVSRAQRN